MIHSFLKEPTEMLACRLVQQPSWRQAASSGYLSFYSSDALFIHSFLDTVI